MLRTAIFLTFVALAFGAPSPLLDIGDWPPHPNCHYNISQQANFQLPNGGFHWYYDSVSSPLPLSTVTCFDWNGNFTRVNGNVGKTQYAEKFVQAGQAGVVACHGPNFADANADFATKCTFNMPADTKFNLQLRVSDTDYKSYALLTFCGGPDPQTGRYVEFMGILGPKKSGIDPSVRQRLVKRLVTAGWNPHMIQRIPSQKDC